MDQNEFARRAEEVKTQLYRTALLYMGSPAAALDMVDEAVYRGFQSCRKLRQPEFFKTWMSRILINACNTELKRRRRESALSEAEHMAETDYDHLPLKEAIAKLPDELRSVVILRFFTGLTLQETAEALALPRGTVSSRQQKALLLLKLDLTDEDEQ